MEVLQQKFRAGTKNAVPVPRVLWHGAYRTHTSSRYGYERHTELEEVPGTGTGVLQNSQKFRVLWYGRTKLTEVPGGYKDAVPVPRVLWPRAYRSSGYGHECPTELTEVLCREIPGENTPGMVLYVPYRTQPWNDTLSCNIISYPPRAPRRKQTNTNTTPPPLPGGREKNASAYRHAHTIFHIHMRCTARTTKQLTVSEHRLFYRRWGIRLSNGWTLNKAE